MSNGQSKSDYIFGNTLYTCICICICIWAYMDVCIYVCVYIYIFKYVCKMYIYMYMCTGRSDQIGRAQVSRTGDRGFKPVVESNK